MPLSSLVLACVLALSPAAPAAALRAAPPRPLSLSPGLTRFAPTVAPLAPLAAAPAALAPSSLPQPLVEAAHAALAPADESPLSQLRQVAAAWDKPSVSAGSDGAPAPAPAFTPGRRGRVTAYFFDVDDNIFLRLPTKIIAFHKITGEELPISTEEFALVREKIGRQDSQETVGDRRINTKDYEYRRVPGGSFREFVDPPGGNNFIGAVRWAVENLPPQAWQGPSWRAFVRALHDPETAAQTAIVTARGHRPESFLEAFRYLQERGFIAHLPAVENLFAVGNSADPAAEKVKRVMALLDRVQAAPLGARARKRKLLHSAGFSDDDWKNFTAMAEGLAAARRAQPARWDRVKIVLYFTGTNHPARRPGAYVLESDGSLRPAR